MENMYLTTNSTIILHCRLYDFHHFHEDAFIHFDTHIRQVDSMDNYPTYKESLDQHEPQTVNLTIIDGNNLLVMPGLVAGHTHIYSTFARGLALPFSPTSFQDILDQLWWKIDKELDLTDVYYSGLSAGVEFLKSGVTSLIDHHASGEIMGSLEQLEKALCTELGLRAGLCFETSDRFDPSTCILENSRFMESHQTSATTFGLFGLHASMSLSDATLKAVKEAVNDGPIHIHVAESLEDQELCIQQYGKRIVERLYDFGLLNKGSILAHCIYINEKEAQLIAQQQCYVALNVTSNMNNSVGLPNFELLKRHGIACMLGNDGMTADIASEWRNTLFAFHHATKSPLGCGVDDIRSMINASYTYMNEHMNTKIGKLEVGYDSDVLAISYSPSTPMFEQNAMGHILYGLAHQFRPKYVWCQGKQCINHYELNEVDYKGVIEKLEHCTQQSRALWNKIMEG